MSRITVKAPGRICLFGDHQDYLELPIIACAIDRYITLSGEPIDSETFSIHMPDLKKSVEVCFHESIQNPTKGNFLEAAIKRVAMRGCYPNQGYKITITGDIPINAGLSSSSAMVVAWVAWLLSAFGNSKEVTPRLIAQIAYEAEVEEQNSPGGKMDQYTSALGDILYLETDRNSHYTSLGKSIEGLLIGVSGIPKNTIGVLGDLRENALRAIAKVQKTNTKFNLATATLTDYETNKKVLHSQEQPFFYAAIKNHLITQEALGCFRGKHMDYKKLGTLMTAHHTALKESLNLTVPRIDAMITAALEAGAYGAKIVGSGGGGSICALAPKGKEEVICTAIKKAGAIDAYAVNVSKGIQII